MPRQHLRDEHQPLGGHVEDQSMYLINLAATGVGVMILALIIYIVWGDR